jgi:uncharacterized protein
MAEKSGMNRFSQMAAWPLKVLVYGYRWLISPVLPASCRYAPSCSEYALEALTRHGAVSGGWYTLKRLARCHPWGGSGYDPVPGSDLGHDRNCHHDHSQTTPHLANHRH